MSDKKLFAVEKAEKTLPLVRRIVGDIVRSFERRESSMLERQKLGGSPNPGSAAEERAFQLDREIYKCEHEIIRYQRELEDLGVELKDYKTGLVDFYSRHKDKLAYLCWKLDEGDRIAWWHSLEGGFKGRQPLPPELRAAFLDGPDPSPACTPEPHRQQRKS